MRILITGASRGMGKTLAKSLVKNKTYEVFGTCRNPKNLSDNDKVPGVKYIALDLTDPSSIDQCFEELKEVDVLVNNAGQSQIGPVEEIPMEKYRALFEINFFGLIKLTQLYLPHMRKQGRGKVINVGSLAGKFPLPYYTSYCATKFALEGFTLGLRNEMKDFGVDVVLVDPNDIKTTIVPEFLCSEKSPYFPFANRVREMVKGKMSAANPPEVVTDKIHKIIESKKTDPIYNIGGNANLMVFMKRLTSDNFLLNRIRASYGLN